MEIKQTVGRCKEVKSPVSFFQTTRSQEILDISAVFLYGLSHKERFVSHGGTVRCARNALKEDKKLTNIA